jgi:hypothetical protein
MEQQPARPCAATGVRQKQAGRRHGERHSSVHHGVPPTINDARDADLLRYGIQDSHSGTAITRQGLRINKGISEAIRAMLRVQLF